MQSWDIEANPGPRGWRSSLSVCHWNLNSKCVEEFSKLSQISAFLNVHQYDIFYLTETFLDSSISSEDPRLPIEGYKLSVAIVLLTYGKLLIQSLEWLIQILLN